LAGSSQLHTFWTFGWLESVVAQYKAENFHIFSFTLASLVLEELVVIEIILVIWLILFSSRELG
jgi:hypothetical protein